MDSGSKDLTDSEGERRRNCHPPPHSLGHLGSISPNLKSLCSVPGSVDPWRAKGRHDLQKQLWPRLVMLIPQQKLGILVLLRYTDDSRTRACSGPRRQIFSFRRDFWCPQKDGLRDRTKSREEYSSWVLSSAYIGGSGSDELKGRWCRPTSQLQKCFQFGCSKQSRVIFVVSSKSSPIL